jgi:GntR family transcriptional regulator
MIFRVDAQSGQPLYLQLMQQIRHAVETGVLKRGDLLPGIRTLAEELVVSHNTIAKAYSELEHEGLLEIRHGSGAFVAARSAGKARPERIRFAQERIREVVEELRSERFSGEEIRRLFEAELFYPAQAARAERTR